MCGPGSWKCGGFTAHSFSCGSCSQPAGEDVTAEVFGVCSVFVEEQGALPFKGDNVIYCPLVTGNIHHGLRGVSLIQYGLFKYLHLAV